VASEGEGDIRGGRAAGKTGGRISSVPYWRFSPSSPLLLLTISLQHVRPHAVAESDVFLVFFFC
jgi:hypothetical protein